MRVSFATTCETKQTISSYALSVQQRRNSSPLFSHRSPPHPHRETDIMRTFASLRTVVPFTLAAALVALPASPRAVHAQVTLAGEPVVAVSAKLAGIYRVILSGPSLTTQRMHLIVRLGEGGYTCVLLSGDREMPLENLRLEGDVMRATTATSAGRGEIVLTVTEDGVSGTLRVGPTKVSINGERVG
jgi:hypothetical protein